MHAAEVGLATLLSRDRVVVVAALVLLTLLAWAYLLWLSVGMTTPMVLSTDTTSNDAMVTGGMAGMDMSVAMEPAFRAWAPADFAFTFAMWSVMMVGMMTPSVAPMILIYAGVSRKATEVGKPLASTAWFLAGYLAVWVAFSAIATCSQWALNSLALVTPIMAADGLFGGILLVAVGVYQWSPLKDTCLRACQSPVGFLMAHGGFGSDWLGAVRLGVAHGTYCLGCCAALMALLFVVGVMNLLWIAGLTILILLEKVVPAGRLIPRITGLLIGAAGVWLLMRAG